MVSRRACAPFIFLFFLPKWEGGASACNEASSTKQQEHSELSLARSASV